MADFLIHHLEKKGQEHSSLAMLVNQWGFDQLLIPKALQNVGSLFPHYSRHDESHSKQILVNIERLLADNLSLLTATDTWLLLEAAYWHDIGMVVPQKALEDALAEQGFKDYLAELSRNEHHELHRLASQFDARNPCQCFAGAHSPVDAVDKFRQLMAEWFRRRHARRASEVVQSPWQTIGLNSPRTELIPSRLFRLLGQICLMHGSDFDTMMERLPFREAGMAQEDCHPRFVACLLRLGDLLDLDDNRFCPVMQNIAGDNRPALSKAHEAKHQSIRHLRMDRDRIEVSAECEDIDSYLETWKWFDWLKQEMQQQMSRWSDIVPRRELGLLPTLGELTVSLNGQRVLRDGERPQFSIEGKNAVKLLQGSNLYSDRFACINELVQNAIDSTLIRIWLTDGQHSPEEWGNPLNAAPQKALQREENCVRVEVDIKELDAEEEGYFECVVTVCDTGTGIHQKDLIHMLKIGGSRENAFRQKIIRGMPEWMKPSGVFGIGLQSVFLWADKINIETQSFFDRTGLSITLHDPKGKMHGLVSIQDQPFCVEKPSSYGTKLSFKSKLKKAQYYDYIRQGGSLILSEIDPALGFPVELIGIAEKLAQLEFSAMPRVALSRVGLTMIGQPQRTIRIPVRTIHHGNAEDEVYEESVWWYDQERQLMITREPGSKMKCQVFYRGRLLTKEVHKLTVFPFNLVGVNILSKSAEHYLDLNRSGIKQEREEEFRELVLDSLGSMLQSGKMQVYNNNPAQALFRRRVARHARLLNIEGDDTWMSHLLERTVTIKDFLDSDELYLGRSSVFTWCFFKKHPRGLDADAFIRTGSLNSILENSWLAEWKERHSGLGRIYPTGKSYCIEPHAESEENPAFFYQLVFDSIDDSRKLVYEETYFLSTTAPEPLSVLEAIAGALIYHLYNSAGRFWVSANELDGWRCLALKDHKKALARHLFFWVNEDEDFILLPFWLKTNQALPVASTDINELEDFYRWVAKNLKTPMSIEVIRKEYQGLIRFIDGLMLQQEFGDRWAEARGLPHPEPSASTAGAPTDPTQQ